MNSVYISRQPVFYSDMSIYGYKLLYQGGFDFPADSINKNEDKTNAFFIDNILLVEFRSLTDGAKGFIKFTKNLILSEAPLLFPKESSIIELPGNTGFCRNTVNALEKLKKEGYVLALDDCDISAPEKYDSIISYIDIIKLDFNLYTDERQLRFIDESPRKTVILAKNIENREDFGRAKKMGYKLFQGAFYGKPVTVNPKTIGSFSANLIFILNELHKPEPDFDIITSAFQRDVELSYKALRMVNSAYYGVKYHTDSLRMALIQIGIRELTRWVNVMLLKGVESPENAELIKNSIIRGKMLSLLAIITGSRADESNFFICGMFSSIDVLLGEKMSDIVKKLPLGDEVCKTLLGEKTDIRKALDAVALYENGYWDEMAGFLKASEISQEAFVSLYVDAIRWQSTL